MRRRRLSSLLVCLAVAAPLALLGSPATAAPALAKPYDFDGNRYPELVVGAPGLSGAVPSGGAGGVVVLKASSSGVSTSGEVITLDSAGVPGTGEGGDDFGAAVTSADYDGDGYADLAVGQPGTSVDGHSSSGAVTVVYGSAKGLSTNRSVTLNLRGGAADYARFGTALASADLDDDGYPDLAVGAPTIEATSEGGSATGRSVGEVSVFRGGSAGLSAARSSVLATVDAASVPGNIQFGAALAAADLNRDGVADLVVASTGVADRDDGYPGSVSVCFGAEKGSRGCTQVAQAERYAGVASLAVGDVSGSSTPEIALGVTNEVDSAGSVYLFELVDGTPSRVKKVRHLTQASKGVPGSSEYGDGFGSSVAIGDLDEDGHGDLVIGSPGEDEGRGRATVVHGARKGWTTSGNKTYDQDTKRIPGVAEPYDNFGASVSLLDLNADGRLDLAIGAPRENESGAITTLRGTRTGLTTKAAQTFGLAAVGYPYPDSAQFGATLGH